MSERHSLTNDSGKQIFSDRSLSTGSNSLNFSIPIGTSTGNTFARFRFSTNAGILPTGIVNDGKVEDYQVNITPVANNPDVLLVKRLTAIDRVFHNLSLSIKKSRYTSQTTDEKIY